MSRRIDSGQRANFPSRIVDAAETSDEVRRALIVPHEHTHRERGSDPLDSGHTAATDNGARLLGAYIGF